MEDRWYTVREYAELNNITAQAVRHQIKVGKRVLSKKENGKYWVKPIAPQTVQKETPQVNTSAPPQKSEQSLLYEVELKRKLQLQNDLKSERLANLRQDTIIKKQKQLYTKEMYRQQYVQGVFTCFADAFSNLKNLMIELKLSKENNEKMKRVLDSSLKKFEQNLKNYLADCDKRQLTDDEA